MSMRLVKHDFEPYETATYPLKETYLWEKLEVHRAVETICGLDDGDIANDIAEMIYDNLDTEKTHRFVEEWFSKQVPDEYNKWWHERNDWLEDD